jgi:cephalosporin hydroxylase
MKLIIDTDTQTFTKDQEKFSLYSQEAFDLLSEIWMKVGWNAHYHYTFSWLGQPILQLPEDILRLQEVFWELKPDVIIETGIAFGGSLLLYASLCVLTARGRVIGIDVDLHPNNREALQGHPLSSFITLVEGNSIETATFKKVRSLLSAREKVCVILDANHSKHHVLAELKLYSQLVTKGCYIIVADGFKKQLIDVPRGKKEWLTDNPLSAIEEFLEEHPEFQLEYPERRYNRSEIRQNVTHFQGGWLRKVHDKKTNKTGRSI